MFQLFLRYLMGCFGLDTEATRKSPSTINVLPSETLLEIFYKLPIQQLDRNKIVSKHWSSLISHPSFLSENLVRRNSSSFPLSLYQLFDDNNVEYLTHDGESMSWSKDRPKFLHHNKVLASCNRFLLCTKTYNHSGDPLHVYNLVTKQWFPVPSPKSYSRKFSSWGIVCNRNQSHLLFSTQITQFKLVRIVRKTNVFCSNDLKMEIFDSVTNCWKTYPKKKVDRILMFSTDTANAVEHRGILYWTIEIEDDKVLLAFDINLDTFVVIPLPGITGLHSVFGASRNHLYFVTVDSAQTSTIIWRYDEFEGEKTWDIHRRFDLDWIDSHIYVDLFSKNACLLAIDPVDCNVLYVSAPDRNLTIRRIYSLNLGKKAVREISSSPRLYTSKPICRVLPCIDYESHKSSKRTQKA